MWKSCPRAAEARPAIKSIELYALPQTGVFTQSTQSDVDGVKVPAVEVAIGDTATTILIPGKKNTQLKWIPDSALFSASKHFKKGDNVTVRFSTDGDKNWLKEITKAAKPKATGKTDKSDKADKAASN